jgi:hypothetical protein
MKTIDGRVIPSSDRLLHDLLEQRSWIVTSTDELTLLRQGEREVPSPRQGLGPSMDLGRQTQLLSISKSGDSLSKERPLEIKMVWNFKDERDVFPWLVLALVSHQNGEWTMITRGLCAPESRAGLYEETWHITSPNRLPPGDYSAEAFFADHSRGAWSEARDGNASPSALLSKPVPIGNLKISTER